MAQAVLDSGYWDSDGTDSDDDVQVIFGFPTMYLGSPPCCWPAGQATMHLQTQESRWLMES